MPRPRKPKPVKLSDPTPVCPQHGEPMYVSRFCCIGTGRKHEKRVKARVCACPVPGCQGAEIRQEIGL